MVAGLQLTNLLVQDVAGIVASMTPCFRLYSYIGCKLATEHQGHDHAFSAWIRTYSGEGFLQQADKIEELFNVLAKEEDRGEVFHPNVKTYLFWTVGYSCRGLLLCAYC